LRSSAITKQSFFVHCQEKIREEAVMEPLIVKEKSESPVENWLWREGARKLQQNTLGYLLLKAEKDPSMLWRAHRRVYQAIVAPLLPNEGNPIALSELTDPAMQQLYHDQSSNMKKYPAFRDFYGIEEPLACFGEHFRLASFGMEEERQVLWLYGPPSSGKSSVLETLVKRMEKISFWALEGCSFHEHPLHVVPEESRAFLYKMFYFFRGMPCRKCSEKLIKTMEGKWWDMPVCEVNYSFASARGIAFMERPFVPPTTMGEYPREWHKILQEEANGGLLIIGFAKHDQPAELRALLADMVQSGRMNEPGSAAQVFLDFAIIAVSNESLNDYVKAKNDPAFLDRATRCAIPSVVSPAAEQLIHQKISQYASSPFHFMPHVEDLLNSIVCASRLTLSQGVSLDSVFDRLRLYDGKPPLTRGRVEVSSVSEPNTYRQLKTLEKQDGILPGLSVRASQKIRGIARSDRDNCLTFNDMTSGIMERLEKEELDSTKKSVIKRFFDNKEPFLEGFYHELLLRDLTMAWTGVELFRKNVDTGFQKYLDHVSAYVNKQAFVDDKQKEALDEGFLKYVEEQLAVIGADADKFRREIVSRVGMLQRSRDGNPRELTLRDLPMVEEAVMRMISAEHDRELRSAFLRRQDVSQKPDISQKPFDPARLEKKREAMKKELEKLGYHPCCIDWLFGAAGGMGGYLATHVFRD